MRIVTIVGARPQFVKAAVVSRAIDAWNRTHTAERIEELLIHTGQHHDTNMSQVFFEELGLREPAANLGIAGGSHGAMTGRMLAAIETQLTEDRPDWLLVYGDTNSTLAGALAAAKLHIHVAHVEAGLRSFNRRMPEEVNRVLTDHLSTLLLCPTETALENLGREGIRAGVSNVGDVMYDASLHYRRLAEGRNGILDALGLQPGGFALSTCHRAENTDDPVRLKGILSALREIGERLPVVLPLHPRTRKLIEQQGLRPLLGDVRLIEPVSFLDMIQLEANARLILTDSGGVQKEAYFFGVPCVTLRDQTEWVETVAAGWNRLAGADKETIVAAADGAQRQPARPDLYGDGAAGERIVRLLLKG